MFTIENYLCALFLDLVGKVCVKSGLQKMQLKSFRTNPQIGTLLQIFIMLWTKEINSK